jgi:hypothetical protein
MAVTAIVTIRNDERSTIHEYTQAGCRLLWRDRCPFLSAVAK